MTLMLRGKNTTEKGLGLPMPQGQVMVFEKSEYGPLLAGETTLKDRAVGEDVEIAVGTSVDVRIQVTPRSEKQDNSRWDIKVTNARNAPVNIEVEIPYELRVKSTAVTKINGVPTWKATVAGNDSATLSYEIKLERD